MESEEPKLTSPIQCKTLRKYLYDYIEGELHPQDKELLDNHIQQCQTCHKLVVSYRLSIESARIRFQRNEKMPEDYKVDIIKHLTDHIDSI